MKKAIKLIAILVTFAVLLTAAFACGGDKAKRKTSEYVSSTLTVNKDGTFKILQLTDTHFINSTVESDDVTVNYTLRDEWAKEAIRTVIQNAKPDMIALTGDTIFTLDTIKMWTKTDDNYAAFKKVADYIDSFDIPWTFVFGNHDEEGNLGGKISPKSATKKQKGEAAKKKLGEYLTSANIKNCLYVDGPDNITGLGNYIVNVVNKDGSLNNALVMLDSGSYLEGDQRKYEYVHDDQLDWYEEAIRDIAKVENKEMIPSLIFQHIPTVEYRTVLEKFIAALEALGEDWHDTIKVDGTERSLTVDGEVITYHGGVYNEGEVCASYVGEWHGVTYDGGHEFQKIKELGSTKYVFCGHDHRNTYSFTYQGICLTYGMSIDYCANGIVPAAHQDIYDKTEQRGGTLITLNADSSVSISQVPFTRNLYREALEAQNS